ncbi:Taf13 protein [Martiniozyma asiatica (nom. inval.)]|nr:Taf13 protein [Martiniozyma asiatica]
MNSGKRYPRGKQRHFTADLKSLLYAFGDCQMPHIDTIHTLEDVVTTYLLDVIMEANKARKLRNGSKMQEHDLRYALRNDPVKLGRLHDLLKLNQEITKAKKMIDTSDKNLRTNDREQAARLQKKKSKKKKITDVPTTSSW